MWIGESNLVCWGCLVSLGGGAGISGANLGPIEHQLCDEFENGCGH